MPFHRKFLEHSFGMFTWNRRWRQSILYTGRDTVRVPLLMTCIMLVALPNECLAHSAETTDRILNLQEQNLLLSIWLRGIAVIVIVCMFGLYFFSWIAHKLHDLEISRTSHTRRRDFSMHDDGYIHLHMDDAPDLQVDDPQAMDDTLPSDTSKDMNNTQPSSVPKSMDGYDSEEDKHIGTRLLYRGE